MGSSLTLLAAAIALPLVHFKMEHDRQGRRVAMLVLTALTGIGVVGSPILHPLKNFIVNEEQLENRYGTVHLTAYPLTGPRAFVFVDLRDVGGRRRHALRTSIPGIFEAHF